MTTTTTPVTAPGMPDEVVTRTPVQDVALPGGAGTLALVTLDNGHDHTRPNTFGPQTIAGLPAAVDGLRVATAPTTPVTWVLAPACSATAVREPLVLTGTPGRIPPRGSPRRCRSSPRSRRPPDRYARRTRTPWRSCRRVPRARCPARRR